MAFRRSTHAERLRPDVVLLDVRMPNMDGSRPPANPRLALNRARVVMLTTFDHEEYVYDAFNAGATGFLRKGAPPERLVTYVRAAGEGMPSSPRRHEPSRRALHPAATPGASDGAHSTSSPRASSNC